MTEEYSEHIDELIKLALGPSPGYFYKIVRKLEDGKLTSAVNNDIIMKSETVSYENHKWTYPNKACGPLCVFDTLADAQAFLGHRCLIPSWQEEFVYQVWQCRIIKSDKKAIWLTPQYSRTTYTFINQLPDGTVLADAVMLIHPVYEKRFIGNSPYTLFHRNSGMTNPRPKGYKTTYLFPREKEK